MTVRRLRVDLEQVDGCPGRGCYPWGRQVEIVIRAGVIIGIRIFVVVKCGIHVMSAIITRRRVGGFSSGTQVARRVLQERE